MKLRCKHNDNGDRIVRWWPAGWTVSFEVNVCSLCGSWLSLGPSNDSPAEVQIEIRAAEIAAGLYEDGCWMSPFERWGFNDEMPTLRGGGKLVIETSSQRAGYLARCIHSHQADAEGE